MLDADGHAELDRLMDRYGPGEVLFAVAVRVRGDEAARAGDADAGGASLSHAPPTTPAPPPVISDVAPAMCDHGGILGMKGIDHAP